MLLRQLSSCFSTWATGVEEAKRLRQVGNKVMRRFLMLSLSSSFATWFDSMEESKRLRHVCQRVGARWLKAGLFAKLQQWKAFVDQRLHDKDIVQHWLTSVLNREFSSALRTWKEFVQYDRIYQQQADKQSELDAMRDKYLAIEAAAQQQRMKRIIGKFRHGRLSRTLLSWKEFISLRRKYRRFAKKLFQHKLLAVFNTWYSSVNEQIRLRNICQRVIQRMLQRMMVSCFENWTCLVEENKKVRVVRQRFSQKILQRKMKTSFCTWINCIEETRRLRAICKRVGARWHKAGLVTTIKKWKEFVAQRYVDKEIVQGWLNAVENCEVSSAMRAWKVFVEHDKFQEQYDISVNHEHGRLLYEYMKRKRCRLMFRCASQWRRVVVRCKNKRGGRGMHREMKEEQPSLDKLVDLIGQLIAKNVMIEQTRLQQQRTKRAETKSIVGRLAMQEQEQYRVSRHSSPSNRNRVRPRSSPALSPTRDSYAQTAPAEVTPSPHRRLLGHVASTVASVAASVPKYQPWISGVSTSPSHSKVVAEHRQFMKPYRFRQQMYDGRGAKKNQSPVQQQTLSREELLKNQIEGFLQGITKSYVDGNEDGGRRKEKGGGGRTGQRS